MDFGDTKKVADLMALMEKKKAEIIKSVADQTQDLFAREYNAFKASAMTNEINPLCGEVVICVVVDMQENTMVLNLHSPVRQLKRESVSLINLSGSK
jgi:basic membrane lipoprotein Med (substrate-binding protein (PBP1-ABC) superfamily)